MQRSRITAIATACALTLAACSDAASPPAESDLRGPTIVSPQGPTGVMLACRGSRLGLACDSVALTPSSARGAPAPSFYRVLGGQGSFILLATTGAATYQAATKRLSQSVTIKNLLDQPMGTADGATATDQPPVVVFFHSGPTNGVTVVSPDRVDNYTGTNQPAYAYFQVLPPNTTSRARVWTFQLPTDTTNFGFQVYVYTQLPDESHPVTVPPHTFSTLATGGGQHTCAVRSGGETYCWGSDETFQLGVGINDSANFSASPKGVLGAARFTRLALGSNHSCGLTASGAAYCWGAGSSGQRGDNTTNNRSVAVAVAGGLTLTALAAGNNHTCGLTAGGAAYCWGQNSGGQLGDGTTTQRLTPTAVAGGLTFKAIAAAASSTCALTTDGAAYCWGTSINGELGTGTYGDSRSTPAAVVMPSGVTFTSIASGSAAFFFCALGSTGAPYCWGDNSYGKLGDGTTTARNRPTPAAGGLALSALALGTHHSCGLTGTGTMYCWGRNDNGQLGATSTGTCSAVACSTIPIPAAGDRTFTALTAGAVFTCGLAGTGVEYCWGKNSSGQLGDGTTTDRAAPVLVSMP